MQSRLDEALSGESMELLSDLYSTNRELLETETHADKVLTKEYGKCKIAEKLKTWIPRGPLILPDLPQGRGED